MESQPNTSSTVQSHQTTIGTIPAPSPVETKDRSSKIQNVGESNTVDHTIESSGTTTKQTQKRKRKRTRNLEPSERRNTTYNTAASSTTTTTATTTSTKNVITDSLLHPNFAELAKLYPEFELAWNDLRQRRDQRQQLGCEPSSSTGTRSNHPSNPLKQKRQECFSTNVDFDFNLALSRALLDKHFNIALPSMPRGNLCPPIPNRFKYVLWINELVQQCHCLQDTSKNDVFVDKREEECHSNSLHCRGMDLGIGASAIYPLLLSTQSFTDNRNNDEDDDDGNDNKTWKFFGTDVDPHSIQCAQENINANKLEDKIKIALVSQSSSPPPDDRSDTDHVSNPCGGPVQKAMEAARSIMMKTTMSNTGIDDKINMSKTSPNNPDGNKGGNKIAITQDWVCFDFCMTNPPFYSTTEEVTTPRCGDARSRTDMTLQEGMYPNGGEVGFVKDMIHDSFYFRNCITWFTSMVGRKSSLLAINLELKKLGFERGMTRTTEFVQGKIRRWGVAWTFRKFSIKLLAMKLTGGLTSFDVECNDSSSPAEAREEVSRRISSFCETFKDSKLRYQKFDDDTITIEDETPEIQAFGKNNHQFLVDIKLELMNKIQTNENVKALSILTISVNLTLFAHSNKGIAIARKIQSQMYGEVSRTNRRWRRKNARKTAYPINDTLIDL